MNRAFLNLEVSKKNENRPPERKEHLPKDGVKENVYIPYNRKQPIEQEEHHD